ncbi:MULTISPECIES: nuclear transport factor 2 family protein [Paraburkholderia]|uniref:Nuclear transport factor 2 family protein n=1 Tax=Paraburkholderia podalyriae TaxID=1938811 RepID=A0ABR7PTF2_9BURK|nr:nuclear transport factor 2 family protein [Paraburkholderia podalyriae]MBC8749565.1 nuclear transport factor 2 family protein [Paraburkholderia podalyriae]
MTHDTMTALDTILAKQACHDLVVRFALLNDARDTAGLAALFAPDGVMRRPDGTELRGHPAIAAAYSNRPADRISRHHVGSVLIDVESPRSASGTSSVLLWTGSTSDPVGPFGRPAAARQVLGEFHDRFVKTDDGWRIAERVAHFTFVRETGA